jgi:hypothetical protein
MYLHPSAANLLRDTIYALGESDQIFCTTHSPWMIDLSKNWQSLTNVFCREKVHMVAIANAEYCNLTWSLYGHAPLAKEPVAIKAWLCLEG